jgi:hypothetical protein
MVAYGEDDSTSAGAMALLISGEPTVLRFITGLFPVTLSRP